LRSRLQRVHPGASRLQAGGDTGEGPQFERPCNHGSRPGKTGQGHHRPGHGDLGKQIGDNMKVSIIGGGGLVGSMTAYALQCGGIVSSICLIDAKKDMALGQATDLLHGASLVADQRISAGGMEEVASSNVVVVTAGLRRKPEESRLDLINRNVDLFLGLLDQIKAAGLKENAYLV